MTTADAHSSPVQPKIPDVRFRTVLGVARVVPRSGASPLEGYKPVTLKLLGQDFDALAPVGQTNYLFTSHLRLKTDEATPAEIAAHDLRMLTVTEGDYSMVFAVSPESLARIEAFKTQC